MASKSLSKTAEGARADLETSLKELQRDYIELYQCHFVKDQAEYQKVISSGGAFAALRKAKEEGLIGHIGITSHSLDVLDLSLDTGLFETIMVCFSFLEPLAREKIIPKAVEKKVGVIAMKPFSGGVIETANLALKYVFDQPEVVVIAGVERRDLFDENWAIFQKGEKLNGGEIQEIAKIQEAFEMAFCRRCDYCQPCPEEVPIQAVLGIRSMVKRMGKAILQKGSRHRESIDKARGCTGCEECKNRCPYQLAIPQLIQENLSWVDEQFKSL